LWDDGAWRTIAAYNVEVARNTGSFTTLIHGLDKAVIMHVCSGELTEASSLNDERETLTEALESPLITYGGPILAAWQGREIEAEHCFKATSTHMLTRRDGRGIAVVDWARSVLYNSLGRYEEALRAAQAVSEHGVEVGGLPWAARVELIEAASRAGMRDHAGDAFEELAEAAAAAGTDWAFGIRARCRALLSDDSPAESAYREAVERLGGTGMRGELARAHLVYGEWLRRTHRRLEARQQLRTAYDMFATIGAAAFAARASREVAATGESIRKRRVPQVGNLTAQEAQIAALVRAGLTNSEIGARLFISPRTVEWHLRNVFNKLQISSRRELTRYATAPLILLPVSGSVQQQQHKHVTIS
jgi:DNA-binding CsgD family transcriptional regulator